MNMMLVCLDGKWYTLDGKEVPAPPPAGSELLMDDEGAIHITPIPVPKDEA